MRREMKIWPMRIPLVSVCHLVPDRNIAGKNQSPENRDSSNHAEGADRARREGHRHQPPIRDKRGDSSQQQIEGHEKGILAARHVKYSREDHDQRQADSRERRELRFDSGYRGQDQANASQKLTDANEDEQALRYGAKPGDVMEHVVPHRRVVSQDFAEAGEAEEDSPQYLQGPEQSVE